MFQKISLILLTLSLLTGKNTRAQTANAILSKWMNPSGEGQILIYKKGIQYFGKLVWLKSPDDETTGKPKTDIYNPDATLHSRPILGLEILKNFAYKGDNAYVDGTIYDPKSGKTYSCKMSLNNNQLKIRGYIGISIIGRTEVWTRVN